MAIKTKTEKAEIKKLQAEILKLILDKTGVSYNSLIEHAKWDFILNNLDVVTPDEAQKYQKVFFYNHDYHDNYI
jgi:hypothetical protein